MMLGQWERIKRREKWWFDRARETAESILSDEPGALREVDHEWQLWWYEEPGVTLVFYPHKVKSTGNRNVRVRDQNSSNKVRARNLLGKLNTQSIDYGHSIRCANLPPYESEYSARED